MLMTFINKQQNHYTQWGPLRQGTNEYFVQYRFLLLKIHVHELQFAYIFVNQNVCVVYLIHAFCVTFSVISSDILNFKTSGTVFTITIRQTF